MRILIHSHSFLPTVGGVEVFTDRLARYLVREGDKATVVTATPPTMEGERAHDYAVQRRPSPAVLRRLVAEHDLVHMNGFSLPLFLLARLGRRPLLWFHHDYDTVCPKSIGWDGASSCSFSPRRCYVCLGRDHAPRSRLRRMAGLALRKLCLGFVGEHAAHNRYVLERLGLPKGRVLPCAAEVDPRLSRPGPSCEEENQDEPPTEGRPFALFVGRLIREKGCDVALRAVADCYRRGVELDLVVCGDGPERRRLSGLAVELGVESRVRIQGFLGAREVEQQMRKATCIVVPSLWDEPTGAVALEAMACGRPVVASEVGGLGELVGGFGLVFPRGDHRALSARMQELVRSPELRRSCGQRALAALAGGLDWGSTVQHYRATYHAMGAKA